MPEQNTGPVPFSREKKKYIAENTNIVDHHGIKYTKAKGQFAIIDKTSIWKTHTLDSYTEDDCCNSVHKEEETIYHGQSDLVHEQELEETANPDAICTTDSHYR